MAFGLTVAVVLSSDEGVYVDTYGKIAKNVVLQWGEEPTSVGELSLTPRDREWFSYLPLLRDAEIILMQPRLMCR